MARKPLFVLNTSLLLVARAMQNSPRNAHQSKYDVVKFFTACELTLSLSLTVLGVYVRGLRLPCRYRFAGRELGKICCFSALVAAGVRVFGLPKL